MSLKAFHFFFIVVSMIFSAYFSSWCLNNYKETNESLILAFAVGSLSAMALLFVYLIWFLKKSKNYSFLAFAPLLLSTFYCNTASACATCVGNPNHPLTKAANMGVWFLMMVISAILVGFAGLFVFWGVRSRNHYRASIS